LSTRWLTYFKMNLFFPSHDIALGNGVKHFNPPKAAQLLQEDLAWLEDVFCHYLNNDTCANDQSSSNANDTPKQPLPWGWDWDTRQFIHKEYHIPLKELPTDEDLENLRQLSSRKTTIQILQELHFEGMIPKYLTSTDAVDDYIKQEDNTCQEFVLKTPWSSSGRGLIRSSVTPREVMRQRAYATIQKMGGIMAERWYSKQQDFAMLFFVDSECVSFVGYSLFDNDESGTYRQGYLLSNEEIEHRLYIGTGIQRETLHHLRDEYIKILNTLFSPFFGKAWKVGFIGIDMMTIKHNPCNIETGNIKLHPCVEMNLRCTMGVIARLWFDQHLEANQTGRFNISPMGKDGHFEAKFLID